MKSPFRTASERIVATRIDPDLPLGIHEPKREGDVGWDLECMRDVTIGPMESMDVPVNLKIALPSGYYADVRNRSSMARRGLYVDQNVIDTGYQGPLFVFIRNMRLPTLRRETGIFGSQTYSYSAQPAIEIKAGERIAQLVFHRSKPVWIDEFSTHRWQLEVVPTERGEDGMGSTGP